MLQNLFIAFFFVSSIPQFQLRDTQGGVHTPAEWAKQKAILLFFITTECPVGTRW